MAHELRNAVWFRLLLVLALLLPLVILFFLPNGSWVTGTIWFWLALVLCFWLIWMLLAPHPKTSAADSPEIEVRVLSEEEQPEAVKEVMSVRSAVEEKGVLVFRGRLRGLAATAYEKLKQAFSAETVPML